MVKKVFIGLCVLSISLLAKDYSAVETPFEEVLISSETSGKIVKLNKDIEKTIFNGNVLSINNNIEKKELEIIKNKIKILEQKVEIKNKQYKNILQLSSKSDTEKDNVLIELLNIKFELETLSNNKITLEDTINKKEFNINNKYIKEFLVSEGEYVNTGTNLFKIEDISKSIIKLYVDKEDIEKFKNNKFKINGIENKEYNIYKIDKTANENYVGSYEISLTKEIKDNQYLFGNIFNITTF